MKDKKLFEDPIHVSFDSNAIVPYREKNQLEENNFLSSNKRLKIEETK